MLAAGLAGQPTVAVAVVPVIAAVAAVVQGIDHDKVFAMSAHDEVGEARQVVLSTAFRRLDIYNKHKINIDHSPQEQMQSKIYNMMHCSCTTKTGVIKEAYLVMLGGYVVLPSTEQ